MDEKIRFLYIQSTRFTSEVRAKKWLEVKGSKNISHEKGNEKKGGVAILILDKTDFKTKTIIKDKEEH